MKNQNNTQPSLGKDFFSVLDAQIMCSKEIFEDIQSSVDSIGEIVERIKNRNQIENEFDKIDLDSIETLNHHIQNLFKQFDLTAAKK